jgi:aromatic ring hydroxylase
MDKIHFDEYYDLKFQEDLKQLQSDLAPYVAKFLEMANTKDKLLDKVEESLPLG